jgi:hypothetical protein
MVMTTATTTPSFPLEVNTVSEPELTSCAVTEADKNKKDSTVKRLFILYME